MPLTDAETRDKKGTDEYQTKAYCEYLYRRLCLLEYFHGNTSGSDSQPSRDTADPFAKCNLKDSTWTPPEGELLAVESLH